MLDFLACNRTTSPAEIAVAASLPAGWMAQPQSQLYPVRAGECYPMQAQVTAPAATTSHWDQLTWAATSGTQKIGSVTVRVFVGKGGGLPQ
jgi:hypothetical protein